MDFKFLLFMLERKHAVRFHYPFHLKLGKKLNLNLFLLEQAVFNAKKKILNYFFRIFKTFYFYLPTQVKEN